MRPTISQNLTHLHTTKLSDQNIQMWHMSKGTHHYLQRVVELSHQGSKTSIRNKILRAEDKACQYMNSIGVGRQINPYSIIVKPKWYQLVFKQSKDEWDITWDPDGNVAPQIGIEVGDPTTM